MKFSVRHLLRNIFSHSSQGDNRSIVCQALESSLISQKIFEKRTHEFLSELKVKNLVHYETPTIDANEVIADSLKAFQNPFKLSVLVFEDSEIVGTLNLRDVIGNLNSCQDLKSGFCWDMPVRCLMGTVFVPLEMETLISDIIVDVLNCECLIHPVVENCKLKGVLEKESILDILRIQMLEEAVLI